MPTIMMPGHDLITMEIDEYSDGCSDPVSYSQMHGGVSGGRGRGRLNP